MIEWQGLAPTDVSAMDPARQRPAAPALSRDTRATRGRHDLLVAAFALLLLLAWDASGLDLAVVRRYGTSAGFVWQEHWVTRDLLHQGGRWLGFAVLAVLVVNLRWPVFTRLTLAERWRWLGLTLLCLLAVPAFKHFSLTSCPWSLAEFGGAATYVSHWRLGVADGGSGHCFPSGHATSAFAVLRGSFALRPAHPVAARRWLGGALLFGLLFGWAQMARGAHYPSHAMWTAWACWGICAAGSALGSARRPARTVGR